jgi:hypothetical protein
MRLLAHAHAAAPAVPPGDSLTGWLWLIVAVTVIVVAGAVLASRRS